MDIKGQRKINVKCPTEESEKNEKFSVEMYSVEKSGRVEWLDVARGLAILMLVVFHVLGETNLVYHHFAATTGVHVFLFVSGYFFRGFDLKKNLKKLVLPYVLLLVVVCVYWDIALGTAWPGQVIDVAKQAVLGYTLDELWQGNGFFVGISWFLPLLVSVRLLYALICRMEKENYVVRGIMVVIISCAGVVIGNQGIKLPWSLDVAMAGIFFVYLGDVSCHYQESVLAYLRKPWLVASAFVTWGVLVYCFGYGELPMRSYPNGVTFLLVSSLSVSVVLGISYYISRYLHHLTKVLCVAGKYSFLILCAHVLDKSCLVHSPETNIYLLAVWELFLACVPVFVVCFYRWVKTKGTEKQGSKKARE